MCHRVSPHLRHHLTYATKGPPGKLPSDICTCMRGCWGGVGRGRVWSGVACGVAATTCMITGTHTSTGGWGGVRWGGNNVHGHLHTHFDCTSSLRWGPSFSLHWKQLSTSHGYCLRDSRRKLYTAELDRWSQHHGIRPTTSPHSAWANKTWSKSKQTFKGVCELNYHAIHFCKSPGSLAFPTPCPCAPPPRASR